MVELPWTRAFLKLHLPLPIIDEDLDTMVLPPLPFTHEDFLVLEARMMLLQRDVVATVDNVDRIADGVANLFAEVALLRQQNEQVSQKLQAIHHGWQAPAPPARDPRTTPIPVTALQPPPPPGPPPPAPQPPPPPGLPPPSHEPPPAPHPPPSLILPCLPRCARPGCDKPRHSQATDMCFPGYCCWSCWAGDPYHGPLCGDRSKKKKEEEIAPMAIGLSDFFFLRAHVMCLRAFSLLRALLAPWSLV